jgi:hypothetical protein
VLLSGRRWEYGDMKACIGNKGQMVGRETVAEDVDGPKLGTDFTWGSREQ